MSNRCLASVMRCADGDGAAAPTHALSLVSPAARCAAERATCGGVVLWLSGDAARAVVRMRVGVSPDAANRVLPFPAPAHEDLVLEGAAGGGAGPLQMRQLLVPTAGDAACFRWWALSSHAPLPVSVVVTGAADRPPAADAALPLLRPISLTLCGPAAGGQPRACATLESLRLHRAPAAVPALAAFHRLHTVAVCGDGEGGGMPDVDVGALEQCRHLRNLMLTRCRVQLPRCASAPFLGLRLVHLRGCQGRWEWGWLGTQPRLESLHLDVVAADADGAPAEAAPPLPHLRRLATTSRCPAGERLLADGVRVERLALWAWAGESLGAASLGWSAGLLTEIAVRSSGVVGEVDLGECTSLRAVRLSDCARVRWLSVAGCGSLEEASIVACPRLGGVEGLPAAPGLRALTIRRCAELEQLHMGEAARLETMCLQSSYCLAVAGIERPHRGLRSLRLEGVVGGDCVDVTGAADLAALSLRWCDALLSVRGLAGAVSLTRLDVLHCDGIASLDVAGCAALRVAEIRSCAQLRELRGTAGLRALEQLSVEWCGAITAIDVGGCHGLSLLSCTDCDCLSAVRGLAGLGALGTVVVARCEKLEELDVRGCSSLRHLRIR